MIDKKAIAKYHKRMDARLKKRGIGIDGINRLDFNDKHDKNGRFAKKQGGETTSVSTKKYGVLRRENVKVNGPKQSREYIDKYFKEHPEVKKEAEKYKAVLSNVRDFKEKYPDAENYNSYDPITGKKMDVTSGNVVTFHQNYKIGDEYGAYDDDTYAALCAIAMNEMKPEQMYIGYYDSIEISFNCADRETAKKFAIEHNQHTVYDSEKDSYWFNPFYDKKANPLHMTEEE